MDCRYGDVGVHELGEGVLEEGQVCPSEDASVVGVQFYVNNLLVVGACDGDCGRDFILIGVSIVASIAYARGLAKEMTKLVSCVEVSLRRCEMRYAPSGVGSSVGDVLRYSGVVMVSEER